MNPAALQALLREYAWLDRRRTGEGLTPLEHWRWQDLKQKLTAQFSTPPAGGDRRSSVRVPTRIRVDFSNRGQVRRAFIRNISRGGLFVNTPFALDPGTEFLLRIGIRSTGEVLEIPVTVVSQNVGNDFSTDVQGMGVKFGTLTPEQQRQIDELYSSASSGEDDDARETRR